MGMSGVPRQLSEKSNPRNRILDIIFPLQAKGVITMCYTKKYRAIVKGSVEMMEYARFHSHLWDMQSKRRIPKHAITTV